LESIERIMDILTPTLAYMTPELILPVASAAAAAVGFLLLVGRAPFRLAARGFRYVARVFTGRGTPRSNHQA
jgi:hypothetical protein